VEAGVRKLYFIQSRRTERSKINLERLQKIAVSALKQSGRVWLPEMHGLMNLATFMEQSRGCHHSWIAHCEDASKSTLKEAMLKSGQHRVLIGPEGDFHPDEITEIMLAGFHALDLGNTRLRTETAALLVSFAFSDCLK
jgi:16S rRNA (uracil1498-N3)-methyltransferase